MTTSPSLVIRPRLEARHQEEIDNLNGSIRETHADRATRWSNCQHFRMLDRHPSPVAHVDVERLKRFSLMHLSQLFDGHTRILLPLRRADKNNQSDE